MSCASRGGTPQCTDQLQPGFEADMTCGYTVPVPLDLGLSETSAARSSAVTTTSNSAVDQPEKFAQVILARPAATCPAFPSAALAQRVRSIEPAREPTPKVDNPLMGWGNVLVRAEPA